MNLKQQEEQIKRLQLRVVDLVEELKTTQNDIKNFKEAISRDLKRAFELIERRGG